MRITTYGNLKSLNLHTKPFSETGALNAVKFPVAGSFASQRSLVLMNENYSHNPTRSRPGVQFIKLKNGLLFVQRS